LIVTEASIIMENDVRDLVFTIAASTLRMSRVCRISSYPFPITPDSGFRVIRTPVERTAGRAHKVLCRRAGQLHFAQQKGNPMNSIKPYIILIAFVIVAALSGCVREVIVRDRPPAARVEVVEARPSAAHIWIAGHWSWEGEWVWTRGHWEVPPREGGVWIPGHWVERPRGWVWVEGHWQE